MSRHGGRNPYSMPRASLPAFSWDQAALIRQGKLTACLISATGLPPRQDTVRALRRTFRKLDGDGNRLGGNLVEKVTDQVDQDGEKLKVRVVLTIKTVSDPLWLGQLLEPHALLCGYRAAADLEKAWLAAHPRTERVRLITFACGDVRDRDYFIDRTGGYTLSPSLSVDREAPAVTEDAQVWITRNALTKDNSRMAKQRTEECGRSLATRLKEATKRGDLAEIRKVRDEMDALIKNVEEAA